jgi:uncharacterized protein YecE (DUF72 family)
MGTIFIGTCSWKYPSWEKLVYSQPKGINYLAEYAQKYNTVEVDQWFWSLFPEQKIKLPDPRAVKEYRESVPSHFRFSIKAPNSVTLTHYYSLGKKEPLQANPHFLSKAVFLDFLKRLEPLQPVLGPILLQFEYLNKQKMESQILFARLLENFMATLPAGYEYALEIRNPHYWNAEFLSMLARHRLTPVLLQGYWMPPIADLYRQWKAQLDPLPAIILRLHGEDREGMERASGESWNKIIRPRDAELKEIAEIAKQIVSLGQRLYINVNNHYEGSAPLTIEKLKGFLSLNA